jgi:tRNA (guanine-N7-)-methyltransferase
MRKISAEKIPRPPFAYGEFAKWRSAQKHFAIEIGCGVGFHPIHWAKENPEKQILAIERTKEKFAKFQHRLDNHPQLTNIWPAHADAAVLLAHLDLQSQVDEYFVLYPNPYPKQKHKNLRFAHSALSELIAQTLKPNGILTIATNIVTYADELITDLPKTTGLKLVEKSFVDPQAQPRSHFEKKYLLQNQQCHNLVFRRES